MTLKEYLKQFEGMNPNLEVCYSIDSEGNSFEPVLYSATEGKFNKSLGDFVAKEHFTGEKSEFVNAICIN